MVRETAIYFGKAMRDRWPDPLAIEWLATYPDIFDAADLELTKSQPRNHFAEWLAAIYLYHRDGALSLIEKYGYRNHPRQAGTLEDLLGRDGADFIRRLRQEHHVQPPDLFVYLPGSSRYWFAEVKGLADILRQKQAESHALLAERFGVEVEIITVHQQGARVPH